MKTNMAGLMRWHRNNPRKRLDGYFTVDGKSLTHNQVLAALEYAIEHKSTMRSWSIKRLTE